jgi:hypothetical protein
VQGDEGVLQLRQLFGLAGADPGPDQFGAGASQGLVGLIGNGGPARVASESPPVPLRVDLADPASGGLQSLHRDRPGRRHVDVEGPGKGGLIREEAQECTASGPQYLFVGSVVRDRARCRDDMAEQELPGPPGRREEAVFPAAEMEVERRAGHLRPAHDVGHRDGGVPLVRDRGDRGAQQPLALGRLDGRRGKSAAAPWQAGFPRVRSSETALLLGVQHEPTVTGKFLKYGFVL